MFTDCFRVQVPAFLFISPPDTLLSHDAVRENEPASRRVLGRPRLQPSLFSGSRTGPSLYVERCHVRMELTNVPLGLSHTFLVPLTRLLFNLKERSVLWSHDCSSVRAVLASWSLLPSWTPRWITWSVLFLVPATEGPCGPRPLVFQLHHQALTASSSMWKEHHRASPSSPLSANTSQGCVMPWRLAMQAEDLVHASCHLEFTPCHFPPDFS